MNLFSSLSHRVYYAKKEWWKNNRLLFPSPAEVEFVRLMGGKAIVIDHVKHPQTGFALTIITSMGKILRRELVQRELRVGAMYVDFGFVNKWNRKAVEIDGWDYHRDVIKEQDRDDYLRTYGFRVLHIQAADIRRSPDQVARRVIDFLS